MTMLLAEGGRKAADKAERAVGVKHLGSLETTSEQRKTAAYVAGGVALGLGTLAALYYWDRKGGDLSGKVRCMVLLQCCTTL
jgi:hypothetical protein